jgi:DNA-binding CsgD family transcriptional regulator
MSDLPPGVHKHRWKRIKPISLDEPAYQLDMDDARARARAYQLRQASGAESRDLDEILAENAGTSPRAARAARIRRDLLAARLLDRVTIDELPHTHREIAVLLASGVPANRIADHLHMADGTVIACRREILRSTGAHTVAELTRMAVEQGIDIRAQLGHTTGMAKTKDFKSNVNKHTSRVLGNIKAMAALGPQCDDPGAINKVREAVNKELEALAAHWKARTAPAVATFSL